MATDAASAERPRSASSRRCSRWRSFRLPRSFAEQALVKDWSLHEEAERDLEGFWARQAEELLDWYEKPQRTLNESDAPFYKWFEGGKLNVSYNCLDRHVEAGKGDKVAFHWRGEEGEEREITYADLHRDVQRFANALQDRGIGKGDVVGIYLPMVPELAVAMLACARIGAPHNVVFGGFSPDAVKERMEFSDAKALVTIDGARRKGKTAPIKQQVDEKIGDVESIETIFVVRHTGEDCEMTGGPRRLVPRGARGRRRPSASPSRSTPSTRCTCSTRRDRRRSRRASCTRPAATWSASASRTATCST